MNSVSNYWPLIIPALCILYITTLDSTYRSIVEWDLQRMKKRQVNTPDALLKHRESFKNHYLKYQKYFLTALVVTLVGFICVTEALRTTAPDQFDFERTSDIFFSFITLIVLLKILLASAMTKVLNLYESTAAMAEREQLNIQECLQKHFSRKSKRTPS